ncbi:MAG TPA: phosphorylase [Lichenihabitans sp.]|jgi:hopanoid-associated phosphorylase|nr:phosphorylase [Lichenihabitans sp.]
MGVALPLLAVTGLSAEARIAAGTGVVTLAGGGNAARLSLRLQAALDRGAAAVISFGIAGGLTPGLAPGTTIIGRIVDDGAARVSTDPSWRRRLSTALPHAIVGDLVGVDAPVCGIAGKSEWHRRTGAAAIDMESHVAARLAARYDVPFAALRIVADPADRTVPQAATVGMRADGSTDVGAVLKALARQPAELPGLVRTALDARAAFASLMRSRRLLCALFGFETTGPEPLFARPTGVEVGIPAPAELS